MCRLLLSLLLAGVQAGAPVAVQACEAMCASSDHASSATPGGAVHACHEASATARPFANLSAVHLCGHSSALPSTRESAFLSPDQATSVTVASAPESQICQSPVRAARAASCAPDQLFRIRQLRV